MSKRLRRRRHKDLSLSLKKLRSKETKDTHTYAYLTPNLSPIVYDDPLVRTLHERYLALVESDLSLRLSLRTLRANLKDSEIECQRLRDRIETLLTDQAERSGYDVKG